MNKIHLVSGTTSGIGKALCDLLLAKGEEVIPIVRDKAAINQELYKKIIQLDYSHPEQVDEAFCGFEDKITSFVNCAGILPGKSIFNQDYEGLLDVFNINVLTPMLIIKRIAENIVDGGTIILFGSISGHKGSYDDPYAATKGAVHSLAKSLALKFAPHRRVICIAPGITDNTRMTLNLIEGRYEENIAKVPLGRAADPSDIAEVVYFLLQESCRSITGCCIDINAGQYLR